MKAQRQSALSHRATALAGGITVGYSVLLLGYALATGVLVPRFGLPPSHFVSAILARLDWFGLAATFEPFLVLPLLPCVLLAWLVGARRAVVTGLVALLPFVLYYGPLFVPRAVPSAPETLTIMTHNVLGDDRDAGPLAQAILLADADVVALQELLPAMALDLAPRVARRYPYRVVYGRQGLGLYSRSPIVDADLITLAPEGAFAIRAVVQSAVGPITIFNAHPGSPRVRFRSRGLLLYPVVFDASRRDRAVESLAQTVQSFRGPLLVVGDLNLSERSDAYRALTGSLRDAHREVGRGFGFTFPEGWRLRSMAIPFPLVRIDYALHSSALQAVACRVGPSGGSDHRSVVAHFALADANHAR